MKTPLTPAQSPEQHADIISARLDLYNVCRNRPDMAPLAHITENGVTVSWIDGRSYCEQTFPADRKTYRGAAVLRATMAARDWICHNL